ncbi:hypothetical protein GWI33_010295 [Rhynchophorus ferrugineus]|uniref:Histone-lysine N-methyltransferase SETMAR n=1 Tax=Rhynchophorus ferrugineus TaxID=354439 RepID=A0A834J1Y3_RHYFE|nr:hypothetical protein GWI33_010295 [Rhynchophorus ferrugineus]
MSTEDGESSGRPKEISTEHVHYTIHKYLGIRKLCAKWVPRELTFDKKQRRVDDSEQCLTMIKCNKPEFLRLYVTMDETWLHHFTLKSNRQSSEWTAHYKPVPKRGKTQHIKSHKKVDLEGI